MSVASPSTKNVGPVFGLQGCFVGGHIVQVVAHAGAGNQFVSFIGRYGDQQIERHYPSAVINDCFVFIVNAFDGKIAFNFDVFFIEQVFKRSWLL
jgi:hypothetical protein